jgi:acetate kinase
MNAAQPRRILTINTGSSSLKAGLYAIGATEELRLAAEVDRIGRGDSRLRLRDGRGAPLVDRVEALPSHAAALGALFGWLSQNGLDRDLAAVGHRIVHGGSQYREPHRIDAALTTALQALVPIDPEHLPQALAAIGVVSQTYPTVPQIACFDTAFHRRMPPVATRYALPRELAEAGVTRYGFHGLSYEFILQELRAIDPAGAAGRVIVAHLGNGASLAAVRGGVGVETTMGFTPTGGLVMGTRSGDLDPGVLLYLLQARGMSPEDLNRLVNQQAGLLGVSGSSGDMQDLLSQEARDPRAAEAIELFCYQARKFLGALIAVLIGLDTLVFTAGIGENAAPVRQRICADLEFLGIHLDPQLNAAHAPIISPAGSAVTVRVMKTDEDRMIARHAHTFVARGES